jgi:signal transduction histidine kinase/HAMP domain-containing protein
VTAALFLLLEGLVLLALCLDLAANFQVLTTAGRIALTLLAASGGAGLASHRLRFRLGPHRKALAVLAAAACLLGTLGLIEQEAARRIGRRWPSGARERLESRARTLQTEFSRFLADMVRPMEVVRRNVSEAGEAFDLLERASRSSRLPADRRGFSIHRPGGSPLAWQGNASSPPPSLLMTSAPGPKFGLGGRGATPRLFAVLPSGPGEPRWVSEFLLEPVGALDPGGVSDGTSLDFLPRWEEVVPAHVHLRRGPLGGDDLGRFFERQGDRHWGRLGQEGVTTLSFPLRAPDGATLAIISLKDRRATQEVGAWTRSLRQTGALATAMALLAAWFVAALPAPAWRRLLINSGALWSARGALLLLGDAYDLPRLAIFDIGAYASSIWGELSRSPADLFLTAACLLAQAWILALHLRGVAPPADDRRRARVRRGAFAAVVALVIAGAFGLHGFLDRLVLDARVDIGRVEIDALLAPRLALQISLFLLVSALAMVLLAVLDLALRCRATDRPGGLLSWGRTGAFGRLPPGLRAACVVALLTLLHALPLDHSYERLRRDFFEDDLLPRVMHQAGKRRQFLLNSLAAVQEPEFAAGARFAEDEAADGVDRTDEVAYRLWRSTPMAAVGLASSLQVFDGRGRRLGRFAANLAPMLDVSFDEAARQAGKDLVEIPPRPRATVRKPVISGARWIRAPGGAPLLAALTIADDYDNVPMLGTETGRLDLFRAPGPSRTNPELLRSDPVVAVFGPHLERIYESRGEVPPPSSAALEGIARGSISWVSADLGDAPGRVLYARGRKEIFALAHSLPGHSGRLAAYLRVFLLNCVLAGSLLALRRAAGWIVARRVPRLPAATFHGRLLSVLLLSGLVPVLTLAYFMTRFNRQEFDRELTTSGLSSLQTVRRVAEDYLDVSVDETPSLDDDVVFWLSRVVRQDINIYRDAELLATSTRELYSSGLLDTRLDGSTYRALVLDRRPFRLAGWRIGRLEYLTLSAPMRVDRDGTIGFVSIPLASQRRAVARKVEEVENAILIITCLTAILLALVAYVVARRVAGPIALLVRAARLVAEGDLDVRVATRTGGETAILVESFNRMAASLRDQREDLGRRKDYIEKILGSATTGVVSIDASGSIITINPAAQSLLAGGAEPAQPGANLTERLRRDPSHAPLSDALARALASGSEREAELSLTRQDVERRLRAVFIPFAPEEGSPPGLIVLLEDVTEIVRSGRLAAWAEMTRRVAHEIKNPLTPIQLSVEHIRRLWAAKDARFRTTLGECLDNIQKQVGVLRQIALEFSAYARIPHLKPEPTPVAALLDDALGPYAAAPPPGVLLEREVPPDIPEVLVDRAVIARALVNLVENALQAMPSGGALTVRAAIDNGGPAGGRKVRIEVRDTGVGIEAALMPRLFEPYFSTKSGGTGLGLGMVRKAVEEHGGTIDIRSRPGEGTVVGLTLPVSPTSAARDPA